MAELQGVEFKWRPEMDDGGTTLEEAAALQKNLNRLYAKESHQAVRSSIPVNIWIGRQEALVAAEMPGFNLNQIEVELEKQELRIRGARMGQTPLEGTFTLPFAPDPKTLKARYVGGVLFIHLDRPFQAA
jgi:HSP20 family molecular chaperone IbpA